MSIVDVERKPLVQHWNVVRPTNYPCQLGASVMTVGRTSQSRPSNMIVDHDHNATIKPPARIYTFGYIGRRTGVTTLIVRSEGAEACWINTVDGEWIITGRMDVPIRGHEGSGRERFWTSFNTTRNLCVCNLCVCAVTRHVRWLELNDISLGFTVLFSF